MALVLANLRLLGKTPISRDSEKIDAKGKAIRNEASLRKRDGITPARLLLSLAIAFVTSPDVTFLNFNIFVVLGISEIKLSKVATSVAFLICVCVDSSQTRFAVVQKVTVQCTGNFLGTRDFLTFHAECVEVCCLQFATKCHIKHLPRAPYIAFMFI